MSQALIDAFTDMREADVLTITNELLEGGVEPLEISGPITVYRPTAPSSLWKGNT